MHGIVTLLDKDHYQLIEGLWAQLERRFSVHGVYITPYPHYSYHVAQDYDLDLVESILKRITSNITTFKVRTSGLGIFTGASPVTHETLERIHQIHEEILQDRQGKPFEDSTELIRQMREERTRQLMGEDDE